MSIFSEEEIQSIKQRFGIVGNSPLLNYAIQVAMQVAPTDMSVLITGESGSGKESFSKIIHHLSSRKHGQFIAVNTGAIPEGTIDSELFGHEKGAFTGASDSRKGYFEVTDGGTIFLDEIGEMPLGTQARLLRVLENGEFIRVGSSKVQKTNVRVVAATNVNLIKAVEKGEFREDLYYRLNTVPIFVPPLRERGKDALLLFRKFSADFADKYHMSPISLDYSAQESLLQYRFPGNIRQLRNMVEQIAVLEMSRKIDAETLRKYIPKEAPNLPSVIRREEESTEKERSNFDSMSERDILYKVLFEMRKDMAEMKTMLLEMGYNKTSTTSTPPPPVNNNLPMLAAPGQFSNSSGSVKGNEYPENKPAYSATSSENAKNNAMMYQEEEEDMGTYEISEVEDISHEHAGEESLSIEKTEKDLIIKALRKNNNKRRYAAQDLGISERTLYRKIKQYEIDQ
ncbi:sigma-54 interaction domain-containing protein [Persicobacter psychrovividus]|uniref:Sigma-54-dependent Fis family transcriptional regulator n=1 Tax=Persicobacter psychrovividus TaxID=387638 RepID=A0ABM7VES7_9BACT|nr:sigma-54-dependent Fis family transcriptional regulator [Persicobacter psychrovividus]